MVARKQLRIWKGPAILKRYRDLIRVPVHRTNRYEKKRTYAGARFHERLQEVIKRVSTTVEFKKKF